MKVSVMNNTKEKIQSISGWVSDFKLNLYCKISSILHQLMMPYYKIRNYEFWLRLPNNTDIIWELRKPLIITYITTKDGYCPTCHARAVEYGSHCEDDHYKFMHADYYDFHVRSIFSRDLKYSHTNCECEKLLFEPLDDWYGSGGEEGSSMFTQDCAQWTINKEKGYDNDPLKRHHKQLIKDKRLGVVNDN